MAYVIRYGQEADANRLRGLHCADPTRAYEVEVEDFFASALANWLRGTPDAVLRVAVEGASPDIPVGAAAIEPWEPGSSLWWVKAIAVTANHRGQRLGRDLLLDAIEEAQVRQAGRPYGRCAWMVDPANDHMLRACEELGISSVLKSGLRRYEVDL